MMFNHLNTDLKHVKLQDSNVLHKENSIQPQLEARKSNNNCIVTCVCVSTMVNTECERLLLSFIPVAAVALTLVPSSIHFCNIGINHRLQLQQLPSANVVPGYHH